ncbi:hypothetical protein [Kutzneria chonburiensis]|uniref:Uncharacterized protein n=1 Tax=Kutzneria chonburiensis TaxID=1483604 RepID=A0ABV6N0M8_9PSEU|nr:hypothetical protein [Kutzneria chonburiensis]
MPTFTVSEAGEKAKFVMATVVPDTGAAGADAAAEDDGMSIPGIDVEPEAPGIPARLLFGDVKAGPGAPHAEISPTVPTSAIAATFRFEMIGMPMNTPPSYTRERDRRRRLRKASLGVTPRQPINSMAARKQQASSADAANARGRRSSSRRFTYRSTGRLIPNPPV